MTTATKTVYQHRTSTEVATRKTARDYSHVVVGSDRSTSDRFEDRVISWHSSYDLAEKALASYGWASDLRVEEINGGEHEN